MPQTKYQHLLEQLQVAITAHDIARAQYDPHCATRSAALAKARAALAKARAALDAVKPAPNGAK